jgi:phosphatidylglycerophosphate synthase
MSRSKIDLPPSLERGRLTVRRLLGLDRSGPPPAATLRGQPLRPWTIPNLIGFTRLALIPVFLAIALASGDGTSTVAALLFAFIGGSDYLDGIAARITGQYSRLGVLLDPLVDRLLVVAGVAVCFEADLLPRWALAALALRELIMLLVSRVALRHDLDIRINWLGRSAVWPVMGSLFLGMVDVGWPANVLLYLGLVLASCATVVYIRDGRRRAREAEERTHPGPPRISSRA